MDFTKEMLLNDNNLVNEICCCGGSKRVMSERVKKDAHDPVCPYFKEIVRRIENMKDGG